jgi:alkylation response protein AidB-like acyl-CoA dehydrogenase
MRDGGDVVLNGHKRWIGNGTIADVMIVWARRGGRARRHDRLAGQDEQHPQGAADHPRGA